MTTVPQNVDDFGNIITRFDLSYAAQMARSAWAQDGWSNVRHELNDSRWSGK